MLQEGLSLLEQRVVEETAKFEALRQATAMGILDLEQGRFIQLNEGDMEHYVETLSQEVISEAI